MSDYKIDIVVRENPSRRNVDKIMGVSPEEALAIIYSKYCGVIGRRKAFGKLLAKNVDINVDEFMRIFKVKKK